MFTAEVTETFATQVIEVVEKKLAQKNYPPTLNGQEAQKLMKVSAGKFNEIIHRPDFQFVKVDGIASRYSTTNLLKWINGERKVTR